MKYSKTSLTDEKYFQQNLKKYESKAELFRIKQSDTIFKTAARASRQKQWCKSQFGDLAGAATQKQLAKTQRARKSSVTDQQTGDRLMDQQTDRRLVIAFMRLKKNVVNMNKRFLRFRCAKAPL